MKTKCFFSVLKNNVHAQTTKKEKDMINKLHIRPNDPHIEQQKTYELGQFRATWPPELQLFVKDTILVGGLLNSVPLMNERL